MAGAALGDPCAQHTASRRSLLALLAGFGIDFITMLLFGKKRTVSH